MRIIALLALLIIATIESVTAQSYFNIGVRGGGNSSSITFLPRIRDRVASVTGYQMGGTMQYVHAKHFGIQLDPMLVNLGWREIADDLSEKTFKIDFFHIPLTSYAFIGNGKTRLFANAGVYVNVRLSGTQTVTTSSGSSQTYDYNYQKNRDNLVVYGLTGGGGISYDVGFGIIGADVRVSYSYGNIMKPSVPERDFSRDQVFAITGFYLFKLGKNR